MLSVLGRHSWILLSVAPIACAGEAVDRQYVVDACVAPAKLTFTGIPDLPEVKLAKELETCGTVQRDFPPLQSSGADPVAVDQAWAKVHDRVPYLTLATRDGKIDVRIELRDTQPALVYEARQIAAGTKDVPLKRITGDKGPELKVSVERLLDKPYLHLAVINAPGDKLARDIVRLKGLRVEHLDKLGPAKITFTFDIIPAFSVLQLIADASNVEARRQGDGLVIGKASHAAEIDQLRVDAIALREKHDDAKLRATLEKMIALSKPDPGEFEPFVGDAYDELAEMATTEKNYARAESLHRANLAQLERLGVDKDSVQYALALSDIGRDRWLQDDAANAKALLTRALAMIEQHQGKEGVECARLLTNLARLSVEEGKLDEAAALNLRAYEILKTADDMQWRAKAAAAGVERMLALKAYGAKNHKAARPHFERLITLETAWMGEDTNTLDVERAMLAEVLYELGETAPRDAVLQQQLSVCDKRAELASDECARSLHLLAASRAAQGRYDEAIAVWQRMVDLRVQLLGADSPDVAAARNDLALLQRLSGKAPKAAGTPSPPAGPRTPSKGRLGHVLSMSLAWQLADSLEAQLKAQRAVTPIDPRRLAQLQESLAEAHLAAGNGGEAAQEFEASWTLRFNAFGPCDAETRRIAARLIEVSAAHPTAAAQQRYATPTNCPR